MNLQNDFNKLNSKIQEVFESWDNKFGNDKPNILIVI